MGNSNLAQPVAALLAKRVIMTDIMLANLCLIEISFVVIGGVET